MDTRSLVAHQKDRHVDLPFADCNPLLVAATATSRVEAAPDPSGQHQMKNAGTSGAVCRNGELTR